MSHEFDRYSDPVEYPDLVDLRTPHEAPESPDEPEAGVPAGLEFVRRWEWPLAALGVVVALGAVWLLGRAAGL